MAAQAELAELKKAVEELGHKMDKQMVMVQGLIDLFTPRVPQPTMGLVKEPPEACHMPADETKLCSKDMFKDLAEFHEAETHPKEDAGSLSETGVEGKGTHFDKARPNPKRVCSIDSVTLYSSGVSKSSANPRPNCRNRPRVFSHFPAPLSSVYERLLEAGFIKPLLPTPSPRTFPASHNPNLFCAFHQMPGHLTDACFRLRHAIQDLIDNGTIPPPLPSKPNVISNSMPQHDSNPYINQISLTSTQINPSSTIFNPTLYIIPENQSKPIVSLPSEPEVNLVAIGGAIEAFSADSWTDSDEESSKEKFKRKLIQSKEKTDWQRSFTQGSLELLFSQVGLVEEAEVLMRGTNTLKGSTPLIMEAKSSF